MRIIINLIFCLIAGLMVYIAPNRYDFGFCQQVLVLFIISNTIYFLGNKITGRNINAANFDFFFMFSYGMTNFIYPVFYKPQNPNVSIFVIPFSSNIISKSTAIAYLGYTFYIFGMTIFRKDNKKIELKPRLDIKPSFHINNFFLRSIFIIGIVSFVGYVITGGLSHLQNVYAGKNANLNEVGAFSYFYNIFVICCNLLAIFVFLIKDQKTKITIFIFLAICSLLLLATGSRTVVLGIGLILIAMYGRCVKKITFPKLILFLLIGSFVMTFIQLARQETFSTDVWAKNAEKTEFDSGFDIFMDLIINNRNLYVLVDFADHYGNVYLLSAISDITSPVPGLFAYVSSNMGLPVELISGGALPTYIEFGRDSVWGLGTNLVGETYMGFGYYGVCIIMFLLGWLINKMQQSSDKNIYAFVVYYLLVSHAIFFPRAFYLYQPRTIAWSLLLVFVVLKITKSLYKQKENTINKEPSNLRHDN
ncbi:O-antigen polysaccharide polymerase Wzy [Chryseobacterium sp. DT-3]|uniref:O-antigen polysaccharide polymerase Wzy n=1 Tax=Chryseobacterium sp. DT-3 TaxID=3396164 RepID=UPI003F1BDE97